MTGLLFVGSMLGCHPGHVPSAGETLARLFADSGYTVVLTSSYRHRLMRLSDIVTTLISRRDEIGIQVLQVYGGMSFVAEDLASWLSQRLRHKIVMHIHGGAMPEFLERHSGWSSKVLRRADAIVTPSQFLARAIKRKGFPVRVIPNVIEVAHYVHRLRENISPRLLWMRTFHPSYNPELAIRVLERVRRSFPDTTLVTAGQDKGERHAVQVFAAKLNLAAAVRFPGYLDLAHKQREGALADIFINTSRIDNAPTSVLEACAMGLPVVSTNVGGISDLLTDGETGILVPDDDEEAMAAAVVQLLNDPALVRRLSLNGRKLAEQHSWHLVRPKWEKLFLELGCGNSNGQVISCVESAE